MLSQRSPPRGPLLDPPKKHQIKLLTTPASSTKITSVRSTIKHQSQVYFTSTSKARTKHTVSSTICRKRQITTCDYDRDDNDVGDVGGGTRAGWGTASTLAGPRVPAVDLSWRYLPPSFSLVQIPKK